MCVGDVEVEKKRSSRKRKIGRTAQGQGKLETIEELDKESKLEVLDLF